MAVKTRQKKVYDFKMPPVKNKLVQVLKKKKNASSIADLINNSGLPKYQVEEAMKIISNEYRGHLKVTQSGELLYYFPSGMRNVVKGPGPALKRFWRGFTRGLLKALTFLFKIWIVVMLVGYFIFFLLILIAAVVAAIAASAADRERSRKGDGGGFYLVAKVFELFARIWFWGTILDDGSYHRQRPQKKKGRPLHQSVFAFVFGDKDPNASWEEREKKQVLAFLQSQKGVITLEELMALTGRDFDAAQELINRYLLEFEGSPEVTERGTLLYFFPELLRTTERQAGEVSLQSIPRKQLVPFNNNGTKTNGWLIFFNMFNTLFGTYFAGHVLLTPVYGIGEKIPLTFAYLYHFVFSFLQGMTADPNGVILLVLGVVPLLFSIFFFLIPILRNVHRLKANNTIKVENLRKKTYTYILHSPLQADPGDILLAGENEKPASAEKVKRKIFDRFAAEKRADIEESPSGGMIYRFNELKDELRDVSAYREQIKRRDYTPGETVFDSGE